MQIEDKIQNRIILSHRFCILFILSISLYFLFVSLRVISWIKESGRQQFQFRAAFAFHFGVKRAAMRVHCYDRDEAFCL